MDNSTRLMLLPARLASRAACAALDFARLCGVRRSGDCRPCGATPPAAAASAHPAETAWCPRCAPLELFGLTIEPVAGEGSSRAIEAAPAADVPPLPRRLSGMLPLLLGARPLPLAPAPPVLRVGTGSVDVANMQVGGERLGGAFEVWSFVALCAILAYAQYPLFGAKGSLWSNLITNPWIITLMALFLAWTTYPLNSVATLPHKLISIFDSHF